MRLRRVNSTNTLRPVDFQSNIFSSLNFIRSIKCIAIKTDLNSPLYFGLIKSVQQILAHHIVVKSVTQETLV